MIAREGYPVVGLCGAATLVGIAGILVVPVAPPARLAIALAAVVLLCSFPLFLFRDPRRIAPLGACMLLLAPADGRIVAISNTVETCYLRGRALRLSIYLSLFDVHVNRIPADGVVEYACCVSGMHRFVWRDRTSRENEQFQLGLRHTTGQRIMVCQIAGGIMRRIVCRVGMGDSVTAGDRYGMIRFGSRCDVYVPEGVKFSVSVGDHVRADVTVMATLGA